MGQFRTWAGARPENMRAFRITDMEPASSVAVSEIFAGIPSNLDASAGRVFRLAADPAARREYLAAAMRLTLAKAGEVHYYKYLAALIEDVPLMSAEWQPHMLAATVFYVKGANDPETAPMRRAREVLGTLKLT